MLEGLDLDGMVITADALHGQRETARKIREDLGAHYLLFIKANQPSLLAGHHRQAERHRRRVRGHHLD